MIANPALVASLLVTAGAVLSAAPGFVPSDAALAQSAGARQSLSIEGPTTVEFPENSTAAIATYRVANAASESTISWSIDGTDARRLSIDGSGVLRFGAAKNFERPNDGNRDNEYEIELSAAVGSTQVSIEVIVRVTDVNEPPAFELESAAFSVEENASGNRRVGGALAVTDPDEGDSRTFSVEGEDADLFHTDNEGQIRVRSGAALDYETSGILSLTALVTDQGGLSDSLPVEIRLTDADDPGVVTFLSAKPFIGVPFTATVSDQDGVSGRIRWRWHRAMNANDEFERIDGATRNSYTPVEDDEGYILRSTVSYEDNFEVGASASEISAAVGRNTPPEFGSASMTLTVLEEAPAGTDVGDSVTATDSDGDDLSYTLSGEDASYFEINALTGQISVGAQVLPDSETKDSYSVIVTVTDEAGATGSATVLITVAPPDVEPSIIGPATASYTENGTGVVATYSVADLDNDNVTWSVAGTDAARFSISDSRELSFSSSPDYENPNDANTDNVYEVTVVVSHGNRTAELDARVTVTNVNEAASITGPATVSYAENGTVSVATYTANDPEGDEVTLDIAGADVAQFAINVGGELSFNSPPDYEEPRDANNDNVYEVTVTASDGQLESTLDVEVTVTDVNEAAVIAGPTSVSYAENGTASVATYTATDPEGDEFTLDIAGTDTAQFVIDVAGVLSFNSPPDYENPRDANNDNVYEVTVTASDGNLESTLDVEVTVSNVNEAILVTGPATVSYAENGTVSVATYTAADPDRDGITWGIAGADAVRFAIGVTGGLSFNSPPDYEKPRDGNKDNVYEVTVVASDDNLESTLDVEVTVENVNEAILITGPASFSYVENSTTSLAIYTAADPDGDEITWGVAGADVSRFSIKETGELSFNSPPDYEKPRDANKDNVLEVTVTASDGNLTAELDVEVTVTDVNEAASIIGPSTGSYSENAAENVATYSATDPEGDGITWGIAGADASRFSIKETGELSFNSPPDYEKPRDGNKDNVYEVTVTASDGNLESTLDIEITATNVNEAASITGPATVSHTENTVENVATYSATDPEGDGITWGVAGADMSRFSIKETGELSFNSPPDYEEPRDANNDNVYKVMVTASDGNLESTLDIEITVTDVVEAILITGPATVSSAENGTVPVATYTATDPEGDEVTWDIVGTDVSRFSIKETGELSFNSPPDFENPRDANSDNVYEVTVTASNGNLESTLNIEITVSNVNESPVVTGPATVSFAENGTSFVATYTATDPEGDESSWDIVGEDVSLFSIKETGELSFKSRPDYERPGDANNDNVYEVTVRASDGNFTAALDVEVTVTNVNESVTISGPASVTFAENDTTTVAVYSATDPEGSRITWEVVGTDAARTSISEMGELSFNLAPDYEKPGDANKDNVYELTVTASDGDLTSTSDVEVTVTNVAEPATISGPVNVSYEENGKGLVATYTLVDSERDGDSPTVFLIEGNDAAHFVIDVQGALAFVTPPNFESPVDSDVNNTYVIQIVGNDDGYESGLDVVVEVTDANDAPRFPSRAIVTEIPENSCPGAYSLYRGIGGDSGIETDEDGDPLTYALSGPDERTFVIHPPTGYVTLGPGTLLDFETSRKPFTLRVSVSDGRDDLGNTENEFNADDYLDLTVVVSDIDEPPVFTEAQLILDACGSPVGYGPGQLRREVTAGVRAGSPVGAALSVIDSEGESVRFRIVSQSDPGAFIVESSTGQIMVAPDFSPRDARRVYTLRVAAMEGELESQVEVRIAVSRASRPTPEPDDETSPTPEPETVLTPNDEVPLPPRATEDRSDTPQTDGLAVKTEDDAVGPGLTSARLARVEPVFVPVPRAAQTLFLGRAEVQDQTGHARLTAHAGTLAVPYQVRLTQNEAACVSPNATAPPQDCVCVSVEFFDVGGAPLEKESLNRPALLEIVLRTQDEAENTEIERERAEIGRDSVEVMMRQDDEHEWAYIRGDLRRPADGSSILMVRVRAPGQYMALVTESRTERKAPVSAIPQNMVKTAVIQQAKTTATKSVAERSATFFYEPVVVLPQSQPAPIVSAEPQPWQTMRLLIALLLDVTVALSAGILLQRFTFRRQ